MEEIKEKDCDFNPHKCDLYSLGVCIERMIEGDKKILNGNSLLNSMFNGLLEEEWRIRLDAKDLNKFLINN